MMSPAMWADVPFGNRTALRDFQGYHAIWHQVVAETSARAGFAYQVYPLGDAVGSPIWQDIHQREHVNANAALGITGPPLLTDYDFKDRTAFATFMWVHANESIRLATAAGII